MIVLLVVVSLIFLAIILFLVLKKSCKPHCDGFKCGENSSNGCGGTCGCLENGKCQAGKCCYPNCDGIHCGDDGCGGKCECDSLPNGTCQNGRCCYAQDCNNVFCGNDGCGGECGCLPGATCQSGVCTTGGLAGWTYKVFDESQVRRTNVKTPQECASWTPENIQPHFLNFQCQEDSDCPTGDKCLQNKTGKKFCSKNNVFRYWSYDPSDPSGYNCAKIRQGTAVVGIQKSGALGFDIMGNHGPDVLDPNKPCTTSPESLAGVSNGECGMTMTGTLSLNRENLDKFLEPCLDKNRGDPCSYSDSMSAFSGICTLNQDSKLRCLPNTMCIPTPVSVRDGGTGLCTSNFNF